LEDSPQIPKKLTLKQELDSYLPELIKINENEIIDQFKYWLENSDKYQKLSQLALKFFNYTGN
jgi:hypothetical protein